MFNCSFCDKLCKNPNSHRNHERCCPSNPNRNYKNGMLGKTAWNRGLTKQDPRVRKGAEKLSKSLKGKPSKVIWTEEMRKAKSEWRKQLHKDHPEMHPNRKLAGNRNKMSYPEKVAFDWLQENKVQFEHQKKIGNYYPDFVIGNTIIEIDGEYWHCPEKDKIKDDFLMSLGYSVHRIKAKDFIEQRLKELLGVGKSG